MERDTHRFPTQPPQGLRDDHYRRVMHASLDGYLLTDRNGRILDANPAYCALVGYSLEELRRLDGRKLYTDLNEGGVSEELRARWGQRIPCMEARLRRKDGATVDVQQSVTVVELDGQLFRVAFVRDTTERNHAIAALQRSATLLDQVQDLANLGIWEWHVRDNCVVWSPQLRRIYGADEEGGPASFEGYLERVHPDDRERVRTAVSEALTSGGVFHFEERILWPDGTQRHLRSWGKLVRDASGTPECMYGVCLDITEAVEARRALEAANEELEARVALRTRELAEAKTRSESADRLKSSFLATMSHELRTPLNSILGFVGILRGGMAGSINDEQAKQMAMVQESSEHLLALINDVLDLSKIEAGQLRLSGEVFDVRERVQKVVAQHQLLAEQKGLVLRVELEDVGRIESDRRRFEQILHNLLGNAVKFTDRGSVTVHCERAGSEVRVSVEDTGIGIAPEQLSALFRPFYQADTRLSRRHEGTGLGLAISDKLAHMLNGHIEVESEVERGSVFTLVLNANEVTP